MPDGGAEHLIDDTGYVVIGVQRVLVPSRARWCDPKTDNIGEISGARF